ncbi:MAG: glycerophosphodiester phosphodiesterase family protein [Cellvibrionaceae bacterium]
MKIPASKLVAHRGHQDQFPENSLLAILDAIAAGATNIEFDLQLTKDKEVVLYHDIEMLRLSGVEKSIIDFNRDELTAFFVKEPKRLASRFTYNPIEFLDELLPIIKKHPQITFFLEMKEESLNAHGQDACFQSLQKTLVSIPDNIVYISFDLSSVKRAKEEGFLKTALVFRDWDKRNHLLQEANADYGFINYTRIPTKEAIVADKPIMVYEVRYPLIASQLLERGAAAVETFHIRALLSNS